MTPKKPPTKLPKKFYRFFWDVKAYKVNPSKSPTYVINRLLDRGNLEAVRWVLHNFTRSDIVETIKSTRDMSFKTATFWSHYLNINKEQIKCFQEPFLSMRKQHWLS